MKDINIKAGIIKRELWIFLGILIFTFGLNIFAILHYKTSFTELYSQMYIVVLMSIFFYFVIAGARLLIRMFSKLFHKNATAKIKI